MKGMVLVAALAFSGAFGCSKRASEFSDAKVETAQVRVKQLAHEAYVQWRAANRAACPGALDDLLEYTNGKDTKDPWGHDLMMVCGDGAPPAAKGFGVRSAGPDGKLDTADDVTSWE